jgi:hypothetical protein
MANVILRVVIRGIHPVIMEKQITLPHPPINKTSIKLYHNNDKQPHMFNIDEIMYDTRNESYECVEVISTTIPRYKERLEDMGFEQVKIQ